MLKEEEECVHFQYSLNESTRATNCDKILILALGEITPAVSSVSLENPVESFASIETPQGGSHGTFGWGVPLKVWFGSAPCLRLEPLF